MGYAPAPIVKIPPSTKNFKAITYYLNLSSTKIQFEDLITMLEKGGIFRWNNVNILELKIMYNMLYIMRLYDINTFNLLFFNNISLFLTMKDLLSECGWLSVIAFHYDFESIKIIKPENIFHKFDDVNTQSWFNKKSPNRSLYTLQHQSEFIDDYYKDLLYDP